MKICLIIPPSGFLLDERVFPSLGILKVAATLELQHDVSVCDLSGIKDLQAVVFPKADIYGITTTTPQLPFAGRIEQLLRQRFPHSRVILGGPHVTMVNAAAKRGSARAKMMRDELCSRFDTIIAGDGERAVLQALHQRVSIIDADDPNSMLFLQVKEDLSVRPARHLLDLDSYYYTIDDQRATSLIAQLGCPFGCGFCGGRNSPSFRRMRVRSTEAIIDEMVSIYQTYGYMGFMFYDDELNVSKAFPELMRALVAKQRELNTQWALRGFVKAELLTEEHAELLASAGFKTLLVGFESGSERILWNIQKRASVEDNTRCLNLLHQYGVRVKALMSLGHPGESPGTIQDTQRWLLETRPDEFDVTVITVYPGTPYFDEAQEEQPGIWTYRAPKTRDAIHARPFSQFHDTLYYKGSFGRYESFVHTDALSEQELVLERDCLEEIVRSTLHITYPTVAHEHSMGQQ